MAVDASRKNRAVVDAEAAAAARQDARIAQERGGRLRSKPQLMRSWLLRHERCAQAAAERQAREEAQAAAARKALEDALGG